MVSGPTRPTNISAMMMIRLRVERLVVMLQVSQTVANADTASNIRSRSSSPFSASMEIRTKVERTIKVRAAPNTTKALVIDSSAILRRKTVGCFPLGRESMVSNMVRKVVVLMPPPVEPGQAPMNMRMIVRKRALLLRDADGTVSNPAVRLVTDWK